MGANVQQALVDAYRAPRLTVYGSMVELTAAGTGSSCEGSGLFPNCTLPTGNSKTKRP